MSSLGKKLKRLVKVALLEVGMIEVSNNQVYDLYVAGYKIAEIALLFRCSESTIKRRLKEIKEIKRKIKEI